MANHALIYSRDYLQVVTDKMQQGFTCLSAKSLVSSQCLGVFVCVRLLNFENVNYPFNCS